MNGKLIVLTGVDGGGKSTQCLMLYEWLLKKGFDAALVKTSARQRKTFKFYSNLKDSMIKQGNPIPADLRAIILAYDSYIQICNEVVPLLNKGKIVVADRYTESTDIHLRARGVENEWPNRMLSIVPAPTLSFNIDVDIDCSMKRIEKRTKERQTHENYETLKVVRELFLEWSDYYHLIKIDGTKSEDEVFHSILTSMTEHGVFDSMK